MDYNVFDIVDDTEIAIFKYFSLLIFVVTVISEIGYTIIVLMTIPKNMAFFRILTCTYIFLCIVAELLFLCWKPVVLFPFIVIYPVGLMAPMSSTTSVTLLLCILILITAVCEILIVLVMERQFRIVSLTNPNVWWVFSQ